MSCPDSLHQLYLDCRTDLEALLFSRVQCRETAADISQEAFLRLHRGEDLSAVGNLRAYLFRVAINLLNDHYRAIAVRGTPPDNVDEVLEQIEDARQTESAAEASQQLELFFDALREMPPLSRRIFYLNRFEGLKHREIAAQLNLSVRTVEDHMRRILRRCGKRAGLS